MAAISEEMREQYERAWNMLRSLIERTTDEQRRTDSPGGMAPGRAALHAVSAADFYLRPGPEGFVRGGRFGVTWEDSAEHLPGRSEVRAYLDEVAARSDAWLATQTDEQMLAKNVYEWTGNTTLARLVYNPRHMLYHMGEMSMALRIAGADETPWA